MKETKKFKNELVLTKRRTMLCSSADQTVVVFIFIHMLKCVFVSYLV